MVIAGCGEQLRTPGQLARRRVGEGVREVLGLRLLQPALAIAIGMGFVVAILLSAPGVVFVLLAMAVLSALLGVTLVNGFLAGATIALADRAGIGAACNPLRTLELAMVNAGPSWRVFGRYLLGALIGIAVGLVIPFGGALVLPAAALMAVPAQVDLDETARSPAAERVT